MLYKCNRCKKEGDDIQDFVLGAQMTVCNDCAQIMQEELEAAQAKMREPETEGGEDDLTVESTPNDVSDEEGVSMTVESEPAEDAEVEKS